MDSPNVKVSVQGVGDHFATLCQKVEIIKQNLFFIKKEKANTFTTLIIPSVKSLQMELHSTNLLLTMTPNLTE